MELSPHGGTDHSDPLRQKHGKSFARSFFSDMGKLCWYPEELRKLSRITVFAPATRAVLHDDAISNYLLFPSKRDLALLHCIWRFGAPRDVFSL